MGHGWRWLAKIFAFFGAGVGLFGIGTFTQVNGIASAVKNFFDPNMAHTVTLFGNTYSWATVIACLVLTLCVGLVVLGGIQRISKVAQIVVPFMAVLYVALALIILITNITAVPAAIVTIVKSAFTGSAFGRRRYGYYDHGYAEGYPARYLLQRIRSRKRTYRCCRRSDKRVCPSGSCLYDRYIYRYNRYLLHDRSFYRYYRNMEYRP